LYTHPIILILEFSTSPMLLLLLCVCVCVWIPVPQKEGKKIIKIITIWSLYKVRSMMMMKGKAFLVFKRVWLAFTDFFSLSLLSPKKQLGIILLQRKSRAKHHIELHNNCVHTHSLIQTETHTHTDPRTWQQIEFREEMMNVLEQPLSFRPLAIRASVANNSSFSLHFCSIERASSQ
jgi:hypothetical protein